MLLLVTIFTFSAVLAGNVLSKFSFLAISHAIFDTRQLPDGEDARARFGSAFIMLALIIMAPQCLSFLLCLWNSCFAAEGNNPRPSWRALLYNVLQAALETAGVCIFVFVVATFAEPVVVLAIMPGGKREREREREGEGE